MRALSATELLDAWETGRDQPPVRQALTLLAAACPETPPARLAELSIGQRDAQLIMLRTWTFGSAVAGLATCPRCGDRLDFGLDLDEIRAPQPDTDGVIVVQASGWQVRCRLPTSADLLAISERDGQDARQVLLERCVLVAERPAEAATSDLPPDVVAEVVRAMGEADPQADVDLALTCPACGHDFPAAFDVATHFWTEIAAWAARTLREVHALAGAYGWSEAEILALSPRRRQAYLDLIEP